MIIIIDDDIKMSEKIKDELLAYHIKNVLTFKRTKDCSENSIMKADLIFLDIEMPDENGLEFVKRIRMRDPNKRIIFISSHDEYVFDSFIVQPFFFIRKTNFLPDFKRAMETYERACQEENKVFEYTMNGNVYRLKFRSIIYFEKCGSSILIHTKRNYVIKIVDNLKSIMNRLDNSFIMIDRSKAMNLYYLNNIDGFYAILKTGDKLEISRRRRSEVKHALMEYIRRNTS